MANYLDVFYEKNTKPYTKYPSQLCKHLLEELDMKEGQKLLDVGCGRGDFSKGFKDLGLEVYGLDCEESHSEMLKDVEVRHLDIENEPFPFDNDRLDVGF